MSFEWRCDCGDDECIECGPRINARHRNISAVDQVKGFRRAEGNQKDSTKSNKRGK